MWLRKTLLVLLIILPVPAGASVYCQPWSETAASHNTLVIGEIFIIPENIFDLQDKQQDSKIHHAMNKLHVVTQPDVIKRKLSFKTGDLFDADKLKESERLLRQNAYIKEAGIHPQQICGDTVSITVTTRDNWTLAPGVSFGRSGGNNKSGAEIQEHNLFGWGKSLTLAYKDNSERNSVKFDYSDDQLLGSQKKLGITVENNSDGHTYGFSLESPFYTIDTPESWLIDWNKVAKETSLFQDGVISEQFTESGDTLDLSYSWSIHSDSKSSSRIHTGWHYQQQDIQSLTDTNKADHLTFSYPWAEYEHLENSYLELENFNTMGKTEDVNIGRRFSIRAGALSTAVGSDSDQLKLSGEFSDSFINNAQHLGLVGFSASAYLGQGEKQGAEAELSARYQYAYDEKNTFYLGATAKAANNFLANQQYRLGGMNDLRGYPEGFQTGNKSVVFTAEYRHFFDKSPYQLLRTGAVIFADAGTAWGDDSDPDIIKNVGIGLRLVPTRSSSGKVIHIDMAVPLDGNGEIDSLQFTVGTKTSF